MSARYGYLPDKESPSATWTFLENGVNKIMTKLQEGMNLKDYMDLYTAVHNFCTATKPVGPSSSPSHGMSNRGGASLLGEDLYSKLILYLDQHVNGILTQSQSYHGEDLLRFYIREWKRYTTAAEYINNLFRYLNRHWVRREMDEGRKGAYDII